MRGLNLSRLREGRFAQSGKFTSNSMTKSYIPRGLRAQSDNVDTLNLTLREQVAPT